MPDTPDLPLPAAAVQADTPAAPQLDSQPEAVAAQPFADACNLPEIAATPSTEAALPADAAPTPAAPLAASGDDKAEPTADTVSPAAPAHAMPAKAARDLSPAACADLLKQHFPALFAGPPKPLKLRIQADIAQRAPGVFSKASMSAFFRRYTGSTGYLIALGKASQRFDLDGQPAGELSEEHRQLARDELNRRRQVAREREQQAQAQQQAQQAELLQARQVRLALLRDFERTTLTPANFCALKGLTAETLEPLLVQARREAAEVPPPRLWQPDERRGQRTDDQGGRAGGPRPPRPDHRPAGDGGRQDKWGDRRPELRSEVRNEARSDTRPGARPAARPDTDAGSRPDASPGGRPGGRSDARPSGRPGGRPPGRPPTQR